MKKLVFDINEFINLLEVLRDEGGTESIIIFERDGYPAISDANDPGTILVLKPVEEAEAGDSELH